MAEQNEQNMQQMMAEFERSRMQLMNITMQKQQLQAQSKVLQEALDELKNTKEKKVYKAVGNILILSDTKKVEKDLKGQKDSVDLRAKTMQKQEDSLIDKLNKLKSQLESPQKEVQKEEKKEGE